MGRRAEMLPLDRGLAVGQTPDAVPLSKRIDVAAAGCELVTIVDRAIVRTTLGVGLSEEPGDLVEVPLKQMVGIVIGLSGGDIAVQGNMRVGHVVHRRYECVAGKGNHTIGEIASRTVEPGMTGSGVFVIKRLE